jgi:hypothetical protein
MKRAIRLTTLALLFCFSLGCERKQAATPAIDPNGPVAAVPPAQGAYTGAFIDFAGAEDDVALEAIEGFEEMVGKHQAIIASASFWGEQSFPMANMKMIWRHGSLPLLFWSPWDRPYEQRKGPDRFSLNAILAGHWNRYIDSWADEARAFGHPLIVSLGDEMNGDWFPWSGVYYGGNQRLNPKGATPERWAGPELFKRTYRYVVDRVRSRGARNIQWMFHTNNFSFPMDTWNFAPAYYPGSAYVDWLGLSVYGEQFNDEPWADFYLLTKWPYEEMERLDPTKPIMIAEWATGEFPQKGDKAKWIADAFSLLREKFPRIKAAVYWHERWQNEDESFSNLRVNSSPEALAAYRAGISNPYWLGKLELRPLVSGAR